MDIYIQMLSLEYCKKKLEKSGKSYTDEEVKQIRDLLYRIAKHQIRDLKNGYYE